MTSYCTAAEAAKRLGVSRATLYAYVSRGLVRSEAGDDAHARRYRLDDIEGLIKRKAARQDPTRVAAEALQWGAPVLESALTLIADGHLYYRGHDVIDLARTASLERVAGLLWIGDVSAPPPEAPPPTPVRVPNGLGLIDRFQLALPLAARADPAAFDLRPAGVQRVGLRILRLLTGLAIGKTPEATPVGEQLRRAWRCAERTQPLIDQALVLCADHELNISAFTVRCVASSGATLYAAIDAGLSALRGRRHGGAIERVGALLDDCAGRGVARGLTEWLAREGRLPGFGHPLYPDGDPRAHALLASLAQHKTRGDGPRLSQAVLRHVTRHLDERPTIDFALAAMTRVLALPEDAGLILFALGRTVGWVGHALEAYARDELIRPRARYVGPQPAATA